MTFDFSGLFHGPLEEGRRRVASVLARALAAVDPYEAVRRALVVEGDALRVGRETIDLAAFDEVVALGFGKAAVPMARAVEDAFGARLCRGHVHTKDGHGSPCRVVTVSEGSHPLPDGRNGAATERLCALAGETTERTLVLCLVSGGGSALLCLPSAGLTLDDKLETTRLLLACGAPIQEINAVRRHLSAVKGGQLARRLAPATVVSLVLSDVVGDPLESIASGPTVADPSTFADAWTVIERHGLAAALPAPVRDHLRAGIEGRFDDTPKPGDAIFAKVRHVLVGNNHIALAAAADEARAQGFETLALTSFLEGEASHLARFFVALGREVHVFGRPAGRPALLVGGGETTVTLRGSGLGGRNQEFALAAVEAGLDRIPNAIVAGFATDGTDGPTDASGAFADSCTRERARRAGLVPAEYLAANDAYHFFDPLADLIRIGPTGTNVCDLYLIALL